MEATWFGIEATKESGQSGTASFKGVAETLASKVIHIPHFRFFGHLYLSLTTCSSSHLAA